MTTRTLFVAFLLVPYACVVADDPENRDAELTEAELVASESDDIVLAAAQQPVDEDDDPSCDADLTLVDPGEHNIYFQVVSPQELELDPELDFTIDPDGTTLHADNAGGGITMTCRCEDMCSHGSSACVVSADMHQATCTGTCDQPNGLGCGVCGWHYGDTPAPRDPLPGPKAPKPALPGGGQNAQP